MKKLILLALLIFALPAPAHAFWPFDGAKPVPLAKPVPPPTPEEEAHIMAEKQAQMDAMEQAFAKAHPQPAGPEQPPGPWCLIGHLSGHPGLTPLVCGYHSEVECNAHKHWNEVCTK